MTTNFDSLSKKIVTYILIIGFCITIVLIIHGSFCIYEREKTKSWQIIPTRSNLFYSFESKKVQRN